MENIKLIYEHVHDIKVNTRKKPIIISITEERFNSKSLLTLAGKFKYLLQYRIMPYNIILKFNSINFADKITYIVLEALIYDLLKRSRFQIRWASIDSKFYDTIHNSGFLESVLYRSSDDGYINRKRFINNYEKSFYINPYLYRRFLSRKQLKYTQTPSIIYTELVGVLSYYSHDEDWNDSIAETISELVCNVSSHVEDDCIIDINFGNYINVNTEEKRLGINIAVVNFSQYRLFDKVEKNLKDEKYLKDDLLYNRIYSAYNSHKKCMDENYNEEHFFLITTFQNHVSSRSFSSGVGGTGLTNLITNIIGKAEKDYSYVLSGKHLLFFKSEYLNISQGNFIGFNTENDYFNCRPDQNIVSKSELYIPGTVYQLLIVKDEEYDGKKDRT